LGTGAGIIFKGSGFYATDYRKPEKPRADQKKDKPSGEKTESKAPEKSSESKGSDESG
jgi:predicted nucleic acid-binding Zn ribbon protein